MDRTPLIGGFESVALIENPTVTASRRQLAAMDHLMSGQATFTALQKAVKGLVKQAPAEHDIIVHAFGIYIVEIHFLEPHTLLLRGSNAEGHPTSVVAHYSQMVAHVIYRPKTGPERVITGFSRE